MGCTLRSRYSQIDGNYCLILGSAENGRVILSEAEQDFYYRVCHFSGHSWGYYIGARLLCSNILQHSWKSVAIRLINPPPPSAAYMRQWIGSALVQIKACRLFGAKPLSKAVLGYCKMEHLGSNFCENLIKIWNISFMKMHLKISSAKWRSFCLGGELKRKATASHSLVSLGATDKLYRVVNRDYFYGCSVQMRIILNVLSTVTIRFPLPWIRWVFWHSQTPMGARVCIKGERKYGDISHRIN